MGLSLLRGVWFRGTNWMDWMDWMDSMDSDLLAPRGFTERTWVPEVHPWLPLGVAQVWTRAARGQAWQANMATPRGFAKRTQFGISQLLEYRLMTWYVRETLEMTAGRGRQGCLPHAASRNEPNSSCVDLLE